MSRAQSPTAHGAAADRRSASAAWRCATGCWCTGPSTGPSRCALDDGAIEVGSGAKPRFRGRARRAARRPRRRAAGRGVRAAAADQARGARRRGCRSRTPRVLAAMVGSSAAVGDRAPHGAARPRPRGRGVRAGHRARGARADATPSSPPTTASSTRRSPPTSRAPTPPTRAEGARPLRLEPGRRR